MVTQQLRKPFVYGRFVWSGKPKTKPTSLPPLIARAFDRDRVAVEVLREFSATEFVGKLYLLSGSPVTWTPADMHTVQEQDWYSWYLRIPKQFREKGSGFYFDVEGSGPWKVLYLRGESDDAGPYVAIALQY